MRQYFIGIIGNCWLCCSISFSFVPLLGRSDIRILYLSDICTLLIYLCKEEATVRSSVEAEDANERRYYEYEETLLDYYHGSCILFYV